MVLKFEGTSSGTKNASNGRCAEVVSEEKIIWAMTLNLKNVDPNIHIPTARIHVDGNVQIYKRVIQYCNWEFIGLKCQEYLFSVNK